MNTFGWQNWQSWGQASNNAHRTLTPEQFGAIGGGEADDSAAFASMALALINTDTVALTNEYKIESVVTIQSSANWRWDAGAKIINDCASGACLKWEGGSERSSQSLAVNATAGVSSMAIPDTSAIEVGDIARVSSDAILSDTRNAFLTKQEWVKVTAVSVGSIDFQPPLFDTYLVSDSAAVEVRKPLRGMRFISPVVENVSGKNLLGVEVRYFEDFSVTNGQFNNGARGMWARDGITAVYTDCRADDINEDLGYAMMFTNVTFGTQLRPRGGNNRHSVEISGASKNTVVIEPIVGPDTAAAVSWHLGPEICEVRGGTFVNGADLIMRGQINKVIDNEFQGDSFIDIGEINSASPITVARSGEDLVVRGNIFANIGNSTAGKVRSFHALTNAVIENNDITLSGSGNRRVFLRALQGGSGLQFINNTLSECIPMALAYFSSFGVTGSSFTWEDVEFSGNTGTAYGAWIDKGGTAGSGVTYIDGLTITENDLTRTGALARILTVNEDVAILDFVYANNNAEGGYIEVGRQRPATAPAWGEIIAYGNTGDLPSVTVTTTNSSGVASAAIPDGLRSAGIGSAAAFDCVPTPAGYTASLNETASVVTDGVLVSVAFDVFDETVTIVGAGVEATITRTAG